MDCSRGGFSGKFHILADALGNPLQFVATAGQVASAIIETDSDQIKNIQQVEHARHRSIVNTMVNALTALVAYTHQPCKPSLNLSKSELKMLACEE